MAVVLFKLKLLFNIKTIIFRTKIEVRITKIEIKGLKIIFEHEIYNGQDLAITGTATVLAYNYEEQKVKKFLLLLKK